MTDLFTFRPALAFPPATAAAKPQPAQPSADRLSALRAAMPAMAERDRTFAASLADQAMRRGLSDKQWRWVGILTGRAAVGEAQPETVGDVSGLVALLDRAAKHLKRPAIIVRADGQDMRLSVAGERARVPGSVNVCSVDRGEWFGRVTRDGRYEASRKHESAVTSAIAAALRAMAVDPAKAAAAYGHLTGVCCFCGRKLDDLRSTRVGYGPVCAKHYGLTWG